MTQYHQDLPAGHSTQHLHPPLPASFPSCLSCRHLLDSSLKCSTHCLQMLKLSFFFMSVMQTSARLIKRSSSAFSSCQSCRHHLDSSVDCSTHCLQTLFLQSFLHVCHTDITQTHMHDAVHIVFKCPSSAFFVISVMQTSPRLISRLQYTLSSNSLPEAFPSHLSQI